MSLMNGEEQSKAEMSDPELIIAGTSDPGSSRTTHDEDASESKVDEDGSFQDQDSPPTSDVEIDEDDSSTGISYSKFGFFFNVFRCQFHQHFTFSFYTCRSQK